MLEWRVDPESEFRNPSVGGLDSRFVLMCADGWSSSLAAATLRELGFHHATDLVGGYRAWRAAGLPTQPPSPKPDPPNLPGMEPPEPLGSLPSSTTDAPIPDDRPPLATRETESRSG